MRLLGALSVVLALGAAAPAQARWAAPVAFDRGQFTTSAVTSSPLAAWTDHGRFAFDSGRPVRTALPASFSLGSGALDFWPVNVRGDVLLVAGNGPYDVHALAQDASGASAATRVQPGPGRRILYSASSLAPDATAVIAWSEQRDPVPEKLTERDVSVRIRPPGGQFGPTLTMPTPAPVEDLKVLAGLNGTAELAYLAGGSVYHVDVPGGSPVAVVTEVAESYDLTLAPGRVVVRTEMGLAAAVRGPGGWSVARLASFVDGDSQLAALPDGAAAIGFVSGRRVRVARASAGAPFGAPTTVTRAPTGTRAGDLTLATGPSGELLLAWLETSPVGAFSRVQTAFASPGQAFGRAEAVPSFPYHASSPLVAGISPTGRRLVTWWENPELKASLGDQRPAPTPRADKRPPRVRIDVSADALRAAPRTGRLAVKVTCDEACDVILGKITHKDVAAYLGDGHVVLRRAGSVKTVLRRFPPTQRRQLRVVLRAGRASYQHDAQDVAGNVRSAAAPLPLLVG